MNDWEIRKFFVVILSVQLSFIGLILLDTLGIHLPILRAFFGFILLTFIPGIIILRVLRIHKIGNIRTIIYSIGLSLTFIMFIGLFSDIIYPIIGIKNPLSLLYLMITTIIFVVILCFLSYILDKDPVYPSFVEIKRDLLFKLLFLSFIPIMAIVGTYLVNNYHNNIILMILIIFIGLTVFLVAFNKIPKELYGWCVFLISLSLILHVSLISNYLTGWDVNVEYYVSSLVKLNSFWDFTIFGNTIAVLSINILIPIYSLMLNMDIIWIFKIICPILYSFLPLSLYLIFKSQTNSKISFMACMFFVFFSQFFTLSSYKQMIGEIFLAALVVLIVTPYVSNKNKSILFIIFGASLVVSHYALSYLFILMLTIYFLVLFILVLFKKRRFLEIISEKLAYLHNSKKINFNFFLFFLILTLAWYMYVSSSSGLGTITTIINNILGNFLTDFMSPESAQGYSLLLKHTVSPLHAINKYIFILSNILITLGIFSSLLKDKLKFKSEYLLLSLSSFSLLIFSIVVPYFASSLNTSRIYSIALLFLAPFFVIGILFLLNKFMGCKSNNISLKLTSIFLVIFLLFNTGFLFEIFNDDPSSISLSQNTISNYGNDINKAFLYQTIYTDQDVNSVKWLSENGNASLNTYADSWHKLLILNSYGINGSVLHNNLKIPLNSYLYLGSVNIRDGIFYESNQEYYKINDTNLEINKSEVVYSNGISEIIFSTNYKFSISNLYPYQIS